MAKPQKKKSLDAFNKELAEEHLTGQWIYEDLLNRAIWHSVKGFNTPYNYGRPIARPRPSLF